MKNKLHQHWTNRHWNPKRSKHLPICNNQHDSLLFAFPGSWKSPQNYPGTSLPSAKRVEYCDTLITFSKRVNLLALNNYHKIIIIMSTEIAFQQHTFFSERATVVIVASREQKGSGRIHHFYSAAAWLALVSMSAEFCLLSFCQPKYHWDIKEVLSQRAVLLCAAFSVLIIPFS